MMNKYENFTLFLTNAGGKNSLETNQKLVKLCVAFLCVWCNPDFANDNLALRRMAQFSASLQIGIFSTLHLKHEDITFATESSAVHQRARKHATKARCRKALGRLWNRHASLLLPFCLPSAFAMTMIGG